MKYLVVLLLLLPLCLAHGEAGEFVPPMWANTASLSSREIGARYRQLAGRFEKLIQMQESRDPLTMREAAGLVAECSSLLELVPAADSEGRALLLRLAYWLQTMAGMYTQAGVTADKLFKLTGVPKYSRWSANAGLRSGLPLDLAQASGNVADLLVKAEFLYDLGRYEDAVKLVSSISAAIHEPQDVASSAELQFKALLSMGKPIKALETAIQASQLLRGQYRTAFLARISELRQTGRDRSVLMVWKTHAGGASLRTLKVPVEEGADSFAIHAKAAVFASILHGGSARPLPLLLDLGRRGYRDLLVELSVQADDVLLPLHLFALPFLEAGDLNRACHALSVAPADDGLARLCSVFLSVCEGRGLDPWPYLRSSSSPPQMMAYFALNAGDSDALNKAITRLGSVKGGKGLALLVMCAGMLKSGVQTLPISFEGLVEQLSADDELKEWIPLFGASGVFRAMAGALGGKRTLDPASVEKAVLLATGNSDQLALAITRCTVAGGLGEAELKTASFALAEAFAAVDKGERGNWLADLVEFRLSPYAELPEAHDIVRAASGRAGNHAGLMVLLARAMIAKGELEEARGVLTAAYPYAERSLRGTIENLLNSLPPDGK